MSKWFRIEREQTRTVTVLIKTDEERTIEKEWMIYEGAPRDHEVDKGQEITEEQAQEMLRELSRL